jgi:hypothetical protein
MREPIGGQKSHNAGDDRNASSTRTWWAVRISTLWLFANELCAELGYRGASEAIGVSRAGLQKLVEGHARPNRSTRKRLGTLYLACTGSEGMKKDIFREGTYQPRLIECLPGDEARGRREVRKIFELARRFPDETPGCLPDVEEWLDAQIAGEWDTERRLADIKQRDREWRADATRFQRRVRRIAELVKAEEAAERLAERKAKDEAKLRREEERASKSSAPRMADGDAPES